MPKPANSIEELEQVLARVPSTTDRSQWKEFESDLFTHVSASQLPASVDGYIRHYQDNGADYLATALRVAKTLPKPKKDSQKTGYAIDHYVYPLF